MRSACLCLLALAIILPAQEPKYLDWIDGVAQKQLAARKAEIRAIRTRDQAEARKQAVYRKLMDVYGGLPDYKGPLNAKVTGSVDAGTYRIEKVMFESLPRYWVTANLYVPKAPGKHPAVLFAIGHWDEGKPAAQRMAANLALQGFVVLAFDPMGQGERLQGYWPRAGVALMRTGVPQHWMAGTAAILLNQTLAAYFVHDGKRALDYLTSRPEVDANRIGCTGCSGGGTQATYISALDPRVKVAAPLCYMQSFEVLFKGSIGDSEQSVPRFLSEGLDQTDYVELFAPKPWLIGSTEQDFFTPAGAKVVFEEARNWYELYGAQDRVKWVVGPGGHGTPIEVREAVYEWFNRWLKDGKGEWKERPVNMIINEDLKVTATGQLGPDSRDLVEILKEQKGKNPQKGTLAEYVKSVVGDIKDVDAFSGATEEKDGLRITRLTFRPEDGLEIQAWLARPADSRTLPAVVHLDRTPVLSARAKEIAAAGAVVLAVTPRALPAPAQYAEHGDWAAATRAWLTGLNLAGLRAKDLATAARILARRTDITFPIRGVADGPLAVSLLLASQAEPKLARLWLERAPHNYASLYDSPIHRGLHDAVLPGFATRWDLADLAQNRQVVWKQPTDWNNNIVKLTGDLYQYRTFDEMNEPIIEWLLR
jgi:cephalosporin-C deacetylase-like acetyl esterase